MARRKKQKAPEEPAVASFTPLDSATVNQLRNVGSQRDFQGFCFRPCTLYLTDAEVADIDAFRLRFKSYQAESEKRKLARAFRILDLPPEIRVRIYGFVLGPQRSHNDVASRRLAYTVTPDIGRACGTFRKECLPLFFAAMQFEIQIGTNLFHRAAYRTAGHLLEFSKADRDIKRSGVLNCKKPVRDIIRYVGDAAVFRNVKFEVYEAMPLRRHDYYLECSITFRRGRLQVGVTECHYHPTVVAKGPDYYPLEYRHSKPEDVDCMIEEIRRIATEIEAKEDCKGLKLKDIERMAKVFRFKAPIKEAVKNEEGLEEQDEDGGSA